MAPMPAPSTPRASATPPRAGPRRSGRGRRWEYQETDHWPDQQHQSAASSRCEVEPLVRRRRSVRSRPSAPARRRSPPGAGEVLEDRAFRPMVAVAMLDQRRERRLHAAQLGDLALDLGHAGRGQGLDLRARAVPIAPVQVEQESALLDREAERAGATDETQLMEVAGVVIAITVGLSRRRPDQLDALIEADGLGRQPAAPRRLADVLWLALRRWPLRERRPSLRSIVPGRSSRCRDRRQDARPTCPLMSGRGGGRTARPSAPKQMRYQAAPRPVRPII